ncbi:MAG: sugar ABC transporter substrate-binding protein [Treponema sp.]|jgi:multiple sugar transport system substrate-binding protein|nr:sugar ABC transporter substrate-binding protein [Treponema sp.]
MISKLLKNLAVVDRLLFILVLILLPLGFLIRIGTKTIIAAQAQTLVFTQWWQDELEKDSLKRLVGEFEKNNPGIVIKLTHLSYQEMEERFFKGNSRDISGSDILALDLRWLYEFTQQGMLKPLDPYIEKTNTGETRVFVPGLPSYNPQGAEAVWALPMVSFMVPLFYNVELLQAAGFDRPPKTRADFLHYVRTMTTSSTGPFGMALSPQDPDSLYVDVYSWFWAAGGVMLPGGKPAFTSPPMLETLDFLTTLYREGLVSPDPFLKIREQKLQEFSQGKIAMMLASVQDIHTLTQQMGDTRFGITTVPGLDTGKKPVFGLTSWYIGISRSSEHPDQAWDFITFLAEQSSLLAAASHAVPGNWSGTRSLKGDLYTKAYDMYEGGDGIQEFIGIPHIHSLEAIVREELYTMFTQGQDTATTAAAIQSRWEATLP